MNLISIYFFSLLIVSLLIYYMVPKRFQKYVLLLSSFYFFVQISLEHPLRFTLIICYIIAVTYIGGVFLQRLEGKSRSICAAASILMLTIVLVVLKYLYNLSAVFTALFKLSADVSWLKLAAPIGISYFTLSAIGYLMEVFWKNIEAEKNPFNIALFIIYFPQMISGPVTRYPDIKKQFNAEHKLQYDNISAGALRMIWGYVQKLIISERFAVVVNTIYGNVQEHSGINIILATLCYAIQLYTDFSGCMDIIMGASMLYGIKLPENFEAPFFCCSIKEFWQRWHITLGQWFKDYVMYPVQLTKPFIMLGKKAGKRFGRKAGRKLSFYASMLVLWTLIGIWHGGTGYYFIASAGIPCILLIFSDLLNPYFKKIVIKWKIQTDCFSYIVFQRFRTILLVCLSWIFVCSGGTYKGIIAYKQIITHFFLLSSPSLTFELFGFKLTDIVWMMTGLFMVFAFDRIKDSGKSVIEVFRNQNPAFQYIVIFAAVLLIMHYGNVGNSSFIYFKF